MITLLMKLKKVTIKNSAREGKFSGNPFSVSLTKSNHFNIYAIHLTYYRIHLSGITHKQKLRNTCHQKQTF